MEYKEYGVVTFESTHHAIRGEKILENANLKFKTIPTPREITSSCGLSIRFDLDDIDKVKSTILENELAIKGLYRMSKIDSKNHIEKIN
ncbi:MAG: Se-S-carrier domain-containing protein [Sporanaerobacter sp.]|jgi:hypothetical protein|uniref:DUF3343 domain-containing protein n=1 Tax=Sporanaerobacter sp. TaxID=2010183 RepID=UPI003A1011AF